MEETQNPGLAIKSRCSRCSETDSLTTELTGQGWGPVLTHTPQGGWTTDDLGRAGPGRQPSLSGGNIAEGFGNSPTGTRNRALWPPFSVSEPIALSDTRSALPPDS